MCTRQLITTQAAKNWDTHNLIEKKIYINIQIQMTGQKQASNQADFQVTPLFV